MDAAAMAVATAADRDLAWRLNYDRLTQLAANICELPFGFTSVVPLPQVLPLAGPMAELALVLEPHFERRGVGKGEIFELGRLSERKWFAGCFPPGCVPRIEFAAGVRLDLGERACGALFIVDPVHKRRRLNDHQKTALRLIGDEIETIHRARNALARAGWQLAESGHRARNFAALAQALCAATLAAEGVSEDVTSRLINRIAALGAAQPMLRQPDQALAVEHLIRRQLRLFPGYTEKRIVWDGPPVVLAPKAAEALGLALHELATNAVKYGALSVPEGKVRIVWRQVGEDEALEFEWLEEGGPVPQVKVASESGFGSRLIGPMAASRFRGPVVHELRPEGAYWRARIEGGLVESQAPPLSVPLAAG
jgi:two-component sensor histidine kinase